MSLTPFERGLVAHLVADWLLQNDWMAMHKSDLRHPAGWVHGLIHAILTGVALGPLGGATVGILHLLIDTGRPLNWWIQVFKKCEAAPHAVLIRIATDQALHVAIIAAWVALT